MAQVQLSVSNITDGETVHQRCLLLTGSCHSFGGENDSISVTTTHAIGVEAFPEQLWPISAGSFKALVMLSPGSNTLELTHLHHGNLESTFSLTVTYIPLLQYPPLHLAIMVAKDSPLLIDCPPRKRGSLSSAHSDLEAAIAKFRMMAYLWQAMTAEDLREKGLGRRSFRLDEEWTADTVSRSFINAGHSQSLDVEGAMRASAKVHIIRSSKTTKEIRDENVAQQNPAARRKDGLFEYFIEALKEAGGPFSSSAHPVVAGMILDSHFSISRNFTLGHAAIGQHKSNGISLGMFGSHLTYSWPRFIEEITGSLTDTTLPGDQVSNDSAEGSTMGNVCTTSQGAHLQLVGRAFGSTADTTREFEQDWSRNFLLTKGSLAYSTTHGTETIQPLTNNCSWRLSDALSFRALPHFRLPSDHKMTQEMREARPQVRAEYEGDEELSAILHISCGAGLVQVSFNGINEEKPSVSDPVTEIRFTEAELERRFDRCTPLRLSLLGLNGGELSVSDVWKVIAIRTFVRIPGSNIRLFKRSIYSDYLETNPSRDVYEWAQLLRERGPDGNIHRATSIDLRVGCLWDGGVVTYADGHTSHWGPMRRDGEVHYFGGHASESIELPPNVNIKRIEVNRGRQGSWVMDGVRMHLSNRASAGEINHSHDARVSSLRPGSNEVIVGFYGKSEQGGFCGVVEFGIITAPKSVGLDGLPEATFNLPELKNTAGMEEGDGNDGEAMDEEIEHGSEGEDQEEQGE